MPMSRRCVLRLVRAALGLGLAVPGAPLAAQTAAASQPLSARRIYQTADSLKVAKEFARAAALYARAASVGEFKRFIANSYYAAGFCYARAGSKDSAFKYLAAAFDAGWNNKQHLLTDSDLDALHDDPRWVGVVGALREAEPVNTDPRAAKFVTSDIDNFWSAYDKALRDTADRAAIYKRDYIDRGSVGLQDYFYFKVPSVKSFVDGHDRRRHFYAAIRPNTLAIKGQEPLVRESFLRLKALYPTARFPDIYFIIGNFTSGGTTSDHGLLLGIDQSVGTPGIPLDELTLWERNNFKPLDALPPLIAHELIHFQQDDLRRERTLLSAALVEGMADFIGELISGENANPRLHLFAKGREKQIWSAFSREMFDDRARDWIANANQETPEHPADLGYWVGYIISKSYYDHAPDKKQAVWDMLHIKDYRAFLTASRIEEELAK